MSYLMEWLISNFLIVALPFLRSYSCAKISYVLRPGFLVFQWALSPEWTL